MRAPFDPSAKKTMKFGEKLVKAQEKMADDAPMPVIDLRESIEQDIGKKLEAFLNQETKKHPDKDFYILVFMAKDFFLETAIRLVMQARWTKPEPQPGSFLYFYDHLKDGVELKYSLPPLYSMAKIKAMPMDYDPLLVQWVDSYYKGTLA